MTVLRTEIHIINLAVITLLLAKPAYGQEAVMEGVLPDSIVITASRVPEDARQAGRRVTVWTAEDIQRSPVASFDELLRVIGGVEVLSRGAFGVQSDLTMRGSTFNGVLVLIDGARLNDPMTGHFLTNLPIPLSEIARIEVMRGPASTMYGPDAIGGVIQIFTWAGLRTSSDTTDALAGTALLQRGDYGLFHLDARGHRTGPRSGISVATAWQGSEGAPIESADGTEMFGSRGPVTTDYDRQSVTAALVRFFGSKRLYARVGLDDRAFGAYHFYTPFPQDTAREETSTGWAQLQLSTDLNAATSWSVQVFARQLDDKYEFNPRTPRNEHQSRLLMLQAHLSRKFSPTLTVIGGVLAGLRSIDSNNLGSHADHGTGAFSFARWQAIDMLTINAGLRLDADAGYGLEATPQVNLAYNLRRATLRGGVSRAVRAPSYAERYFNTSLSRPNTGANLGNPDLDAERAWAYEAGFDVYPGSSFSLHGTVFQRDTDNLIDYVMLSAADTVFRARNLLAVRMSGVEVDAVLRHEVLGMPFAVVATYTWLDSKIREHDAAFEYKYALTNARHLLQVLSSLTLDRFVVAAQGIWKEPLLSDPYGVMDLRISYPWDTGRYRLMISGEVRNLFDAEYTEVFDAPMPRRWLMAGIKVQRL